MQLQSSALPGRRRHSTLAVALAAIWLAAACRSGPVAPPAPPPLAPDTWAVVDGRVISRGDVDKAFRRMQDPSQTPSEEEVLAAKLNLLNDLIVQDPLLAKAQALKVEIPPADLDKAYNDAKNNMPEAAFQEELKRRNITADDMREGLRRQLVTQKVIEQEVTSKISVSDQQVSDFFNANKAQFHLAEEAYHIAQIVVTPVREERLGNSTGDDAATPEAAAAKARMLMEKLKGGASFRELAAGYSEDAETAPRGGDLGLVPVSRLKQAPPQLRSAVLGKTPGTVNVASFSGAHTLVLVVAHEPAGQRDLSTPGVKDRISTTLRGRREELLRVAYLTQLRGDAKVVNQLAKLLVDSKGAALDGSAAAQTATTIPTPTPTPTPTK
jgi:peptidyl-prolyl cis-trans isomerase SurA